MKTTLLNSSFLQGLGLSTQFLLTFVILESRGFLAFASFVEVFSICSLLISFLQGNQYFLLARIEKLGVHYLREFRALVFKVCVITLIFVVISIVLNNPDSTLPIVVFVIAFSWIRFLAYYVRKLNSSLGSCDILIVNLIAIAGIFTLKNFTAFECLAGAGLIGCVIFLIYILYNIHQLRVMLSLDHGNGARLSSVKHTEYQVGWPEFFRLGILSWVGNATRLLDIWILTQIGYAESAGVLRVAKQILDLPKVINGMTVPIFSNFSADSSWVESLTFRRFWLFCFPINFVTGIAGWASYWLLTSDLVQRYGLKLTPSVLEVLIGLSFGLALMCGPLQTFFILKARESFLLKLELLAGLIFFIGFSLLVSTSAPSLDLLVANYLLFTCFTVGALVIGSRASTS